MDVLEKVDIYRHTPLTYAETVTAILSLIGGVYLLTPFLTLPFALEGPIALALANTLGITIVALLSISFALWNLWAIYKRNYKQRARSVFWMTMLRLYAILVIILITGFFPMTWLSSLNVLVLQVIFYINNRHMHSLVEK